VDEIAPLNKGISIERVYLPDSQKCPSGSCSPISSAHSGDIVTVRLTVNIPESMYYLMVEDYIPAGSEVLDASLKTNQPGATPSYDPLHPFDEGWGWWYFSSARIYDDHIAWSAQTLPSGTYEFTYQLVILQPGEYRVLPARAWQFYFPEVQGLSAGKIFTIE
jgi:alpha-2-macroglobulin